MPGTFPGTFHGFSLNSQKKKKSWGNYPHITDKEIGASEVK